VNRNPIPRSSSLFLGRSSVCDLSMFLRCHCGNQSPKQYIKLPKRRVCVMLPMPPGTNFRVVTAGFTLRRGIEGGVFAGAMG
jgi:hypothetical protein